MKLTALIVGFICLFSSGCSFGGCSSTKAEQENAYDEYLEIRDREFADFKSKLASWEAEKIKRENERISKIAKCDLDPRGYYRSNAPTGSSFDLDFYESKARVFGVSLCESIVGSKDEMLFEKPEDNSGNSNEAIEQYLVSQRIIKNNTKCFSPTEVAEAEQEISRLTNRG